jgi:hypothetical protein
VKNFVELIYGSTCQARVLVKVLCHIYLFYFESYLNLVTCIEFACVDSFSKISRKLFSVTWMRFHDAGIVQIGANQAIH